MDELGRKLNDSRIGCQIGRTMCNNYWYADDVCLLAPSIRSLQYLTDLCQRYAKNHNIVFNTSKTVCMKFAVKKDTWGHKDVMIDNVKLEWCDNFPYLGYTIQNSQKHCDEMEMEKRVNSLKTIGTVLLTRFGNTSREVKKLLFNTYAGVIYCAALWVPSTKSGCKAKVAYNTALRRLFCVRGEHSISKLFVELRINNFTALRRFASFSLKSRVLCNDNEIIISIRNCDSFYESDIFHSWNELLYGDSIT